MSGSSRWRLPVRILSATGLAALICCGPAQVGSDAGLRPGAGRVIAGRDLEHPTAASALDLIRMLRPHFLRPGGASRADPPAVYVDGARSYEAALGSIPKHLITEIRYLGPAEASFQFGPDHPGGAVIVRTVKRTAP